MAALALVVLASPAAAQEAAGAGKVPVAARDLPRGTVLTGEDIALAGAPAADGRGGVPDPEGWVTRRVISAGEVLREPAITRPNLVTSGEVVQLVLRQGQIELRLVGRAMGSAARGERVHVRVDSRRRFTGVVVDRALVRMERGSDR